MHASPHDTGRIIRAWRGRIGLTQEGLAHALAVTFSTVSRWENGHVRPSPLAWRALEKLAAQLGSSLVADDAEQSGFFDEPAADHPPVGDRSQPRPG